MRPFLLDLTERVTLYLITGFLRLQSKYSTQIYELLKMRQGLRKIKMSVAEVRDVPALGDKYELIGPGDVLGALGGGLGYYGDCCDYVLR